MNQREIKFRAWDRVVKRMYPGEAIIGPRADMSVTTTMPTIFQLNQFFVALSKSLTLMQFTGLKDKNGKEIYEGDLVTWGRVKTPREVNFSNGTWLAGISRLHLIKKLQVIGNVYENPELLK